MCNVDREGVVTSAELFHWNGMEWWNGILDRARGSIFLNSG